MTNIMQSAGSKNSTTSGRRVRRGRRIAAAGALAAVASVAAVAGTAESASAAGPNYLPYVGSSVDYPTWFGGATTLCVSNVGWNYASARVSSWSPFASPEYINVQAGQTRCIQRYWWGVPVKVTNVSYSPLRAWTY